MNLSKDWFLGLDIGTNSIGYAVTDTNYNVMKFKGNGMWGTSLFESANQAIERRTNRVSRRTLERKKQRIKLLQELMAKEISKVDDSFFIRLYESSLLKDDRTLQNKNTYFNDEKYKDKDYFRDYPTIHHLINELMENDKKYDIRLIYLACAYLIKHRGHFLLNIDKKNIDKITDFSVVYNDFENWFISMDMENPFDCDIDQIADILKSKENKTNKQKKLKEYLLNKGKQSDEETYLDLVKLVALMTGGNVDLSKLFGKENYQEMEGTKGFTLDKDGVDETIAQLKTQLDDGDVDLIQSVKNIYDWSKLMNILGDEKTGEIKTISYKKVQVYEEHRNDLKKLKYIIKTYCTEDTYFKVFKLIDGKTPNYCAYSGQVCEFLNKKPNKIEQFKKTNQEEFNKYIKKILEKITVSDEHKKDYDEIYQKAQNITLCPKQVNTDNRVIPYQLYWNELYKILENASKYYEFLNEKDEYGTVKDKILSIMEFRIPYYVGPLNSHSKLAWIKRKAEGKIYPWNFDEMVDKDVSEDIFINRMICNCTYLPSENVLPKNSLLYSKFNVLNEINNIKINEEPISVEIKQKIYNDLFLKKSKVTLKNIKDLLKTENIFTDKDKVSGIDINIKSNLKPYLDFKRLLENNILSEAEVEKIIERITCTNDKRRLKKHLKENYNLSKEDINYVSNLKYSDFGRLSRVLLENIYNVDKNTGEVIEKNIITMLWETNENLMKLLSYNYGYIDVIEKEKQEYYSKEQKTITQRLDDMYVSNAVKRPIIRTLDIVKELKNIMKTPPKKIFVEMARGSEEEVKKGKQNASRKTKIENLYKKLDKAYNTEKQELISLLNSFGQDVDSKLRSKKLFLYFMQLGKCMYTGKPIEFSQLFTSKYDIDHIYPRSKVKDDSFDNTVLVLSETNGAKTDNYPIIPEIRTKMAEFWNYLHKNNLISDSKYKKLNRDYEFTNDELAGFIARQLVETKQSTKVVATLLKEIFTDTEIVYVKAGLVSEFRHKYDLLKCREVNDFHHAKDAYLNIVVGNVYNVKFTKSPINFIDKEYKQKGEKYNLKLEKLLKYNISRYGQTAWIGTKDEENTTLNLVKKNMLKNNIRFVRYSSCQKGALFNLNPLRKGYGQLALKNPIVKGDSLFSKMSDINKYGGYNSLTATYFYLVKYQDKKKTVTAFVPVDLVYALRIKTNEDIINYLTNVRGLQNPQILLNGRKIKYNTLFEIDGYRCHISAKTGNYIRFKNGEQLIISNDMERYIKRLVKYNDRNNLVKDIEFILITEEDEITKEKNKELYSIFINKLENTKYSVFLKTPLDVIKNGKELFESFSVEKQTVVLCKLLQLFRCNTSSGKDLTDINGVKSSGIIQIPLNLSSRNIYIIDQSPTGLFEKKSQNLLELL